MPGYIRDTFRGHPCRWVLAVKKLRIQWDSSRLSNVEYQSFSWFYKFWIHQSLVCIINCWSKVIMFHRRFIGIHQEVGRYCKGAHRTGVFHLSLFWITTSMPLKRHKGQKMVFYKCSKKVFYNEKLDFCYKQLNAYFGSITWKNATKIGLVILYMLNYKNDSEKYLFLLRFWS